MSLRKDMLIAVMMGGPGAERAVSLASGKAVLNALQKKGYLAVGVEVVDETPEIPEGTALVYNLIHGTFGEDGGLQKYLREKGVPFTGEDEETSRVAFDKVLSKEVFLNGDVPTPDSETVICEGELKMPEMTLPYVVKPPREGSSVGIRIVKSEEEIEPAMVQAAEKSPDVLIEQFVEGREMTVGVVGGEVFPVVEIIPPDGDWYDMETKYPWLSGKSGGSKYICPAALTNAQREAVQGAAKKAYDALGIKVYSRVDVLLNLSGDPYVLEANTIPGMTETSLLPMGAAKAGYDFDSLCVKIAELSFARFS